MLILVRLLFVHDLLIIIILLISFSVNHLILILFAIIFFIIHDLLFEIIIIFFFFLLVLIKLLILVEHFIFIFQFIIFDFINSTSIHDIILKQRMFINLTPLDSFLRIVLQTFINKVIT